MPEECAQCHKGLPKKEFSATQLRKGAGQQRCKRCIELDKPLNRTSAASACPAAYIDLHDSGKHKNPMMGQGMAEGAQYFPICDGWSPEDEVPKPGDHIAFELGRRGRTWEVKVIHVEEVEDSVDYMSPWDLYGAEDDAGNYLIAVEFPDGTQDHFLLDELERFGWRQAPHVKSPAPGVAHVGGTQNRAAARTAEPVHLKAAAEAAPEGGLPHVKSEPTAHGTESASAQRLRTGDGAADSARSAPPALLILEGMNCIADDTNWMTDHVLGEDSMGLSEEALRCNRAAWDGWTTARVNFHHGRRQAATQRCREEIASGRYRAILVSDLSHEFEAFQQKLGPCLQHFVRTGGALAFLSCEGGLLQPVLQHLFGTQWQYSGYYRSTFGRCRGDAAPVAEMFPGLQLESFSVKTTTLRDVPAAEACFATTRESVHESLSMRMAGRVAPAPSEVCVAVHRYGAGRVAFFGDVNCEETTVALVRAFFEPTLAIDPDAFQKCLEAKERGNARFKEGCLEAALHEYDRALEQFGGAAGVGEQAAEKAKILSNKAECFLRLRQWLPASEAATAALRLEPGNAKALFRRAKAGVAQGDGAAAQQAIDDLTRFLELSPNDAAALELMRKARATQQQREAYHEQRFAEKLRGAFAGALGGDSADPAGAGSGLPQTAQWASGLGAGQRVEWLVDCYRLRVDDDYCWGGGNLHGLYDPRATKLTVAQDFLIFCKLAHERGALPTPWDWKCFLEKALELVPYAFEKSDAQDKYGSENVFAAMTGGRSLRFTGEVVYGSGCCGEQGDDHSRIEKEVIRLFKGREADAFQGAAAGVFADVGGAALWKTFYTRLRLPGPFPYP